MSVRIRLTRIDVIVGILCSVFLLGVLGMIDSAGQERAKRSVCAYQVREQLGGLISYADDHDSSLPLPQTPGAWFWDLDVGLVNQLLDRGTRRESFYCPSNLTAQKYMDRYWTFNNQTWDGRHFRNTNGFALCSYCYVLQMQWMTRPAITGSGDKKWLTSTNMPDASTRELIVDATLSMDSSKASSGRIFGDIMGGMYSTRQVYDRSSHLRDAEHPWGGTIGFLDGHAAWRPFEEMEDRYGIPHFWW
jgi:hypothetical protein